MEYQPQSAKSQAPIKYAIRQVENAYLAAADNWPDVTKNGKPRSSLQNTILGIRRLGIAAEFDEFHNRKRLGGHIIQEFAQELTDDACSALRGILLHTYSFDPGKR